MVSLVWTSVLASRRGAGSEGRHVLLWVCLLYRWLLGARAVSGVRSGRRAKMWTILSSPKCHKVGRLQLSQQEAVHRVDFGLEPILGGGGLPAAVSLCQLIVRLSAGCDHGLLRLRSATVRLQCVLQVFEAFRWLPSV